MDTNVLIIGSSAAGLVAATTGKRIYPDKKFLVITTQPKAMVPCGIPYVFGSVGSTDKNMMPVQQAFENSKIDFKEGKVVSIDRENKKATLENGDVINFEKLILATGSTPNKAEWLKGSDLNNVFTVPKNKAYIDDMQAKLEGCKKIITIGAGFIGVEVSDELNKAGKDVTLIEKLPNILGLAFDEDIALKAQELLIERGVNVLTDTGVKEILGTDKVEGVLLENGEKVEADAVILSLGYKPNSKLASDAGLPVTSQGFIKVDEYMRTQDPNIFAIGDCAEKKDFITRKNIPLMLASTACAEARTAGMNIFKLYAIKTFSGTISIFATALGNTGFGVAGLREKTAIQEGYDFVTGISEGFDRHPKSFKDTHSQFVKLIVGKESGVILGGEVYGGLSVGELINTIGIIIENRMTVNSLLTAQIGTHPLLTSSPVGYPLIKAAENAATKMKLNCR